MKKTYVLDTNVFLVDPKAFLRFGDNDIVLLYKVVEELEKHKTDPGILGLYARDCVRKLSDVLFNEDVIDHQNGFPLSNGGKLFVVKNDNKSLKDITNNDDLILSTCLDLQNNKHKSVTLITNDTLLRIKAKFNDIHSETYKLSYHEKTLKDVYSGYHILEVGDEEISKFWENKKEAVNIIKDLKKDEDINPNEYVLLTKDLKIKPYPIIKIDSNKKFHVIEEKKLLSKIRPINAEQAMAIDLLMDPKIDLVTLTGPSGTGKSLISIAAGLEQVMETKQYKNMIIIRPIQPLGRDIGFLPGSLEEKLEPWIAPIKDNLRFLMSDDNGKRSKNSDKSLNYLFDNGIVEIEALTYIRGRSINNAFMLIDEAQNISHHELKAILTRVGYNTKIVLNGDIEQIDRNDVDEFSNGLSVAIEKFKKYSITGHLTLNEGVRSEFATLASKVL